jgi:hypothetical protein
MADVFHNSGTTSESYLKLRNFVHEFLLSKFPNGPFKWKGIALAIDVLLFYFFGCICIRLTIMTIITICMFINNCYNMNKLHNNVLNGFTSRQMLGGWPNQEEWNWQSKWHLSWRKIFRDFWWENSRTHITWNISTQRDE